MCHAKCGCFATFFRFFSPMKRKTVSSTNHDDAHSHRDGGSVPHKSYQYDQMKL